MTTKVLLQTAHRIVEHCATHGKATASVILHGGEPLLGGAKPLVRTLQELQDVFSASDIHVSFGMQSNGTLFTAAVGDILRQFKCSIGISADGPPSINDRHRVDHFGAGSGQALEKALTLLIKEYYEIFAGFLVVVNLEVDPLEVFDYLARFNPPAIDFILPYDNHSRLPPGKAGITGPTPYGEWLTRLFDHWYQHYQTIRVREFDNIIRMLIGGITSVESLGLGPVDLIVVETNGEIEAVDSLKASFEGATRLGYNVFDNTFDEVAMDMAVASRHLGAEGLCNLCQRCENVEICGGGYLPNRYDEKNGFNNPSIYCEDLKLIIRHISTRMRQEIWLYRVRKNASTVHVVA